MRLRADTQVRRSILIAVIIAACLCSYFNALFADFVYDDNIFIAPNPYMKSFKFLPKFFLNDFWNIGITAFNSGYYRPLLATSFILDYKIWGNNPFGFHLTNLFLHALVSILIFLFVEILINNRLIAFASSLLFSVHPIHTEAVSFVSGRVDSIPSVFFLLSLILFLKFASKRKIVFYLFSLFCFFASLLAKEMAVTLPLIVICMDYFFLSQRKLNNLIKNWRFHLGFFVILGLYLVIRFYLAGISLTLEENVRHVKNFPIGTAPLWRLFTVIKILAFYLRLLFFPYGLKVDYLFPPANSLFEPLVLLGIAVILLLIFIFIKGFKKYPILSFSILWFFITLLPVSNLFPQGNIFAERYLYIPSIGFSIAIGFLFSWLLKKNVKTSCFNWKVSLNILFFLLIIALARVTYERNKVWENDFALWYETTKATPNSPRAHVNLARVYCNLNLFDKAIKEIDIALRELPAPQYETLHMLGYAYYKKGLVDEAIKVYKLALDLPSEKANVYHSLAVAYGAKGKYKEAIEAGLTALKKNPYLDEARYNLALNYKNVGLIDEAINAYEEYLKTNPNFPGIHLDIGQLYYKKGNFKKAREHWFLALKISKDYQPAKEALKLLEK